VSELERDLLALREAVAWPQTPDAATAVRERLTARPGTRRRRRRLALAALLAVLAGGVAVSPAGASLLRWIGISSTIRVAEIQRLPLPAAGGARGLGTPMTLERARLLADFALRVPARPLRVRFSDAILGGAVTLEYRDATITQFAGTSTDYVQKLVAPPARARRVRVNGDPGVFISGGPTQLFVGDRRGQTILLGGARPGFNVLLWESGEIAFRLETRLGLAGALAFARSVAEGP
jgi:hypothetical protein